MRDLLLSAAEHAASYLDDVDDGPVRSQVGYVEALATFDGPLPEDGEDPAAVLDDLVALTAPGITAMNHPRFFGFVIGGSLPAALTADWMVSTWDQNAGLAAATPAVSAIEATAGRWVADVLGLPADAAFAFVTGCQMAHVTGLAAARHGVLAAAGWDVERDGLNGAPPIRVLTGDEYHVTVSRALRLLGLGTGSIVPVATDDDGAMRIDAFRQALEDCDGPVIVCAQAGNVNTGAVDPLEEICDLSHTAGAWVHVDGAFGLWAAASPSRRASVRGVERADSWATDGHKWLNVPYDCGIAIVADPAALRAPFTMQAAYLIQSDSAGIRDPVDVTPEFSRRARAVPVYAALRSLGRSGVAELVDRLCDAADRFAAGLRGEPGVDVLAAGLNQVLVRFGDDDARTDAVIAEIQRDGTCWTAGTTWRGLRCMRISVSNWKTTPADVERSLAAMRAAAGAVTA